MRSFLYIWCIALVAGITPAFAQNATDPDPPALLADAALSAPGVEMPPGRVGRVSLVTGNLNLRSQGGTGWINAEINAPIFTGVALRTDAGARGEIEIGANTVDLFNNTEIEITGLRDGVTQITVSRGRIGLDLRQVGEDEAFEIYFPQGGIWLLARGSYDVDAESGNQPSRIAVFRGVAQFVGADADIRIEGGYMAVLTGSDAAATIEAAVPDAFAQWCFERDHDERSLAAPYYISPYMTGFAELDSAGLWKIDPEYGPVWVPAAPEEWAPYRFGHWNWIAPWGWTWIDDQPWAFAPSHYGRWALINDHWAWVPGSFVAHPLYAPAIVAFLGTPGVGLSSEDGATVAWFPLAPGEAYWPSYARDVDYVRDLNRGNMPDVGAIQMPADGQPHFERFNEDFANRQFATVVPRSVFINSRPVPPARMGLPEQRLQDAPVLMASPQIAPASPVRVARAAPAPLVARIAIRAAHGSGKLVRAGATAPGGHGQTIVIRGTHLRAPSYAGLRHGRQMIVLHVAHRRGSAGKRA
jgi:hypothetical protein